MDQAQVGGTGSLSDPLWESDRLRLRRCRDGRMLFNKNDTHVGNLLDQYGEYCVGEVETFRALVKPGDIVVDAGANLGALTVPLGKMVGPTGILHSFEPQPHIYRLLAANVLINDLDWVRCWNHGLGERIETLRLRYADPDQKGSFDYSALEPPPPQLRRHRHQAARRV